MNDTHSNQWQDKLSSPALISADELVGLLDDPKVKIFDARGSWEPQPRALSEDYATAHIKGAGLIDWTKHFAEQGIRMGLASVADKDGAAASFVDLGINQGDLVVLYDDNSYMMACRMWWAMRYWGFADVRVLNGGWKYWNAAKLPVSSEPVTHSKGTFVPVEQAALNAKLEKFTNTKEDACVIDARGAAGFAGNPDDPRTGHIPGAQNLPFGELIDPETGLIHGKDKLRVIFDAKTPDWQSKPVMTTCGSGYAAAVTLLALAELDKEAALFDGSFAMWKEDPDRPIVQSN